MYIKTKFMIYKNGELWTGWQKELSKIISVKKGETARLKNNPEFYLTDLYKHYKEVAPGRSVPMYCPIMFIMPAYEWQDADGSTAEIRYVEKEQVAATRGNNSKIPTVGKFQPEIIEFVDGFLRPAKAKLDFFWFLMNHPDNRMNPAYENASKLAEHSRPFIFQYRDKDKELDLAYNKEMVLSQALLLASTGLTKEAGRQLYLAMNPTADVSASDRAVTLYLVSQARTNPEKFMKVAQSDDSKLGAIVKEAVAFRLIKYLPQVRLWKFTEGEGDPFCEVTRGVNENDALIDWFRVKDTDGSTLKELEDRLTKARLKAHEE